jgi:uncharacterized oxidoreductase
MKIQDNTILITGGATGIGFALAESLVKAGNKVIICGRRQAKLSEAKTKIPALETIECDVTDEKQRESLFETVKTKFGSLNILINNAGIQRIVKLKKGTRGLLECNDEIQTNLVSPICLSALFIPLLSEKKESAIINISSGLAFIPLATKLVYCATKAAVHSFTVCLRHQLKDTSIKVFEIIPPTVDTDLFGPRTTGTSNAKRMPPSELAAAVIPALAKDQFEIPVGEAQALVQASKTDFYLMFNRMNSW